MSDASKVFDRALRAILREPMAQHGFGFDGSRTFRRHLAGGAITQIVNVQLGQRSMSGKFTVNLGVYVPGEASANPAGLSGRKALEYHCAPNRRERLGRLVPAPLPALQWLPLLGLFFGPKDIWWPFSAEPLRTERSLQRVRSLLTQRGLRWLDGATPAAGRVDADQPR
ncbi:DUF4304 domain-containing protein [Thiocystis violacea]|uniref:DUF4304 domain-containing protein n=1 Tax=Thiocystis violacea TaxID=13725 RepID=UPI0019068F35|nr:DUF4304 domain-containing protein [Thiocystis violacea]